MVPTASVCRHRPVATSQSLIMLSSELDTNMAPFGASSGLTTAHLRSGWGQGGGRTQAHPDWRSGWAEVSPGVNLMKMADSDAVDYFAECLNICLL